MRRRRSTRKLTVYKRKSRKSKKTTRRVNRDVKRRNKQSIKRRNYRGGQNGEKTNLPFNQQIEIIDNMESQGLFYIGDFSKIHKYVGTGVFKPFYIKFPRIIENGAIPFFSHASSKWFHVELYWSSYSLSNIFQKKNLVDKKVNRLDRKVELVLYMEDIDKIETLDIYSYFIDYDENEMLKSIKKFINEKLIDNRWRFQNYESDAYDRLGN